MIELLAPAGSIDSLKSAVENGADAVFLGLKNFNARIKAENFDENNIKDWVEYSHLFGVAVYLVVNTSIKESELDDAVRLIKTATEAGVDAVIVNDIGLICKLHRELPSVVMHFSTQMGIHNLPSAKMAEKLGANRVIVSRESTEQDIKLIKQNTNLEIEAFIHGALCVSFSGGCLLSSFIGGNSGNRGQCLQPCRQKYRAVKNGKVLKEGYLLSTSDLCLYKNLDRLIKSGVQSLKIEGRLKRPEYVAQVVRSYRKALDNKKVSNSEMADNEIVSLKKIYNRGDFSEGYYFGKDKNLMSMDIQGHKGVFAGLVGEGKKFFEKDAFKVVRDGKEIASAVFEGGVLKLSREGIRKSDQLFITSDTQQLLELKTKNKRLPINIKFSVKAGECARVEFGYADCLVSVRSDAPVKAAINAPIGKEYVEEQLGKLADTQFECASMVIDIVGEVFMAKSEINKMRRDAVETLKKELVLKYYDRRSNA